MKKAIIALLFTCAIAAQASAQGCITPEKGLEDAYKKYVGKYFVIRSAFNNLIIAPSKTANNNTYFGVSATGTDAAIAQTDGKAGYPDQWYIIPFAVNPHNSRAMFVIQNKTTGYLLQPSSFLRSGGGIQTKRADNLPIRNDIVMSVGAWAGRDMQAWYIEESGNKVRFASVEDPNVYMVLRDAGTEQRFNQDYKRVGNILTTWVDPKVGATKANDYGGMYPVPNSFVDYSSFTLTATDEPLPVPTDTIKPGYPVVPTKVNRGSDFQQVMENLAGCSLEPSVFQGTAIAKAGPFAMVERWKIQQFLFSLDNHTDTIQQLSNTKTFGSSKSQRDSFFVSMGLSVSATVSATGGAPGIGEVTMGVTTEFHADTGWTWETEKTNTWEHSFTRTASVSPGKAVGVYDQADKFEIFKVGTNKDGKRVWVKSGSDVDRSDATKVVMVQRDL